MGNRRCDVCPSLVSRRSDYWRFGRCRDGLAYFEDVFIISFDLYELFLTRYESLLSFSSKTSNSSLLPCHVSHSLNSTRLGPSLNLNNEYCIGRGYLKYFVQIQFLQQKLSENLLHIFP